MVGGDAADGYMWCDANTDHPNLYWLLWPYHSHAIITADVFLESNQSLGTGGFGKHSTPKIALFMKPSSLRVSFLPCLLGVTFVSSISQHSSSARAEKTISLTPVLEGLC